MKRIVLTFGLIAGAIISAMLVVTLPFMEEMDLDTGAVIGYTSMVLAFLLIFFGVRSYRDQVAGGSVRFGRALGVGALIAVVASLCYVATWNVIYTKYAPELMAKYQAHVLEKERAKGTTEEVLARKQAEMESFARMYQNLAIRSAITFLEPMPVALVVALVSAGVLSRRKKIAAPSQA